MSEEQTNPFAVRFVANEYTKEMRFIVSFNGVDKSVVDNIIELPLPPNDYAATSSIASVMNWAWNEQLASERAKVMELKAQNAVMREALVKIQRVTSHTGRHGSNPKVNDLARQAIEAGQRAAGVEVKP